MDGGKGFLEKILWQIELQMHPNGEIRNYAIDDVRMEDMAARGLTENEHYWEEGGLGIDV